MFFLAVSFIKGAEAVSSYDKLDPTSEDSLKKVLKQEGVLQTWASFKLASLYIQHSKFHEALDLLNNTKNDPAWDFWKNVLLAKTYMGLKKKDKAMDEIKNLPPPPDPAFNVGQHFYENLYEEALAIKGETLTQIFRLHALHERPETESSPNFINVDYIITSPLSPDEKCRALNELGDIFRNSENYLEALMAYSRTTTQECSFIYLPRALYWKARLLWKLHQPAEALHTYQSLIQKFPDHRLTDDAFEGIWKIYRQLKEDKKADEAYNQLMEQTSGDRRSVILWDKAYPAYKKKNFEKAIAYLDQILSKKSSDDEFYPQALYWKGRCLEKKIEAGKRGKKSTAQSAESTELYHRVINEFPFSFYAVLSAKKLGVEASVPSLKTPNPAFVPLDTPTQEFIMTVNELNRLRYSSEAQDLLDYFTEADPSRIEKLKPVLAQKWMESGASDQTIAMAFDHYDVGASEGVLAKNDEMAFALYPIAYPVEVQAGAKASGLPKSVIEGIMREESLFQHEVRSWAGAIGVMQLMPATANIQAKTMGMGGCSMEDLANPKTNILLGSGYLSHMLQRFNGQLPYAIMSYNAGPGNVKKWLKRNGKLPLDEFIEEVPLSETRGYVKRVMRSIGVYSSLLKEGQKTILLSH